MSYRFSGQNRALRGYGGSVPSVVHCLYDVNGSAVQSLYTRDISRYGGDGKNVCYRSNSFTSPPRVPVPTRSVNTCISDLYGRTIYDLYDMPVCYVPSVAYSPAQTQVLVPPLVQSAQLPTMPEGMSYSAPSTSAETPLEIPTPTLAWKTPDTVAPDGQAPSFDQMMALFNQGMQQGVQQSALVPQAATMSPEQMAWEMQDVLEDAQAAAARAAAAAKEEPKDNKAMLVGGILLLAAVGGVVYYKMRKS